MSTTTLDLGPVRPVHKGVYSATTSYELLNIVSYNGSSWMVITTSYVVGTTPVAGTTWGLLAEKGDIGSDATVPIATTSVAGKVMASASLSVATDGTATVPAATESLAGIVERATNEEASAGTDTTRFVTPYHLQTYVTGVPTGVIVMWSGTTTTIPDGWALCDGTNDTPDLRNRFIMGAGSTYAVGATGGSTVTGSTTLTEAQMPSHTHDSKGHIYQASSTSDMGAIYHASYTGSTNTYSNNIISSGSSNSHTHTQNLPSYYALAYIMKL